MHKMILRTLPALLSTVFAGGASAAAFQLMEQNASGIGVSYAGSAAVAENASTIFYNPAGMTQLNGFQFSGGVVGVNPNFKFKNDGSSGTGVGAAITGLSTAGDAGGGFSAIPNAYFSAQLAKDWYVGLGISAPFGLATDYKDNNWMGKYQAIKSEIKTVNVNPSLAYRVNDKISLGLGLNYQKVNAEMTNIVPTGATTSAVSQLKGDDTAWGWNAGAMFTLSPAMRVGVAYRSSVKYDIEGNQTIGSTVIPAKAKLELPDSFTLSVWQQVSDRWEAMGDLSYTNWSTVKQLNVIRQSNGALLGTETFGYKDAWRFAWGAAYKASEDWKVKFGIAYDRTPTTDTDRSARVPDNDRIWFSVGAQWKPVQNGTLDVGYAYLYLKDPKIEQAKTFSPAVLGSSTLRGRYSDSGHVLGVQYSHGF